MLDIQNRLPGDLFPPPRVVAISLPGDNPIKSSARPAGEWRQVPPMLAVVDHRVWPDTALDHPVEAMEDPVLRFGRIVPDEHIGHQVFRRYARLLDAIDATEEHAFIFQ